MSHKKKKYKPIPKKKVLIENPLIDEVENIRNKIMEEDKKIYDLNSDKRDIVENLVDIIMLNNDIKELLNQYISIDEEIKTTIKKQENRKNDLKYKEEKLEESDKEIVIEKTDFKTASDAEPGVKMGLYNRPCKNAVAYCATKQVFLNYNDIRNKKCLKHRDKKPCKHLIWLNSDGIY